MNALPVSARVAPSIETVPARCATLALPCGVERRYEKERAFASRNTPQRINRVAESNVPPPLTSETVQPAGTFSSKAYAVDPAGGAKLICTWAVPPGATTLGAIRSTLAALCVV